MSTLEALNCIDWYDIKLALDDLRSRGSKRDNGGVLDTLVACAAALGARQSNHSSITGVIAPADTASFDVDQVLLLDLGRRREAACLALCDRACAIAEETQVLAQPTIEAKSLTTLMQVAIENAAPDHPFLATLTRYNSQNLLKRQTVRPLRRSKEGDRVSLPSRVNQ